jgi:predicted CXXCH cytochrome family protein
MSDQATPPGPARGRGRMILVIVLAVIVVLAAVFYLAVLPGFSVANQDPSAIETHVATWLLKHSVPAKAAQAVNPLGKDVADIMAGRDLFTEKCEICHAYDGGGRTQMGAGDYPRPPVLRTLARSMTDGEIFYHIRNGIRNTAMPAWNMPDRQVWQLVVYIRHLPIVAPLDPALAEEKLNRPLGQFAAFVRALPVIGALASKQNDPGPSPSAHYVGSAACKDCHQDIYARWSKTRMANIVRDPRVHPDAIIPDLSTIPDGLPKITKDDIGFVYGSHWKQRYFKKVGDDYFPLPIQWDIVNKKWSKYHVPDTGGDWWAQHYPDPNGDNSGRPTGPLCDGCHSVNYNIDTKTPSEWNVGCEMCHGAGSDHAAHPMRGNILNPARMDYVHASDTCIQCHSQGQPLANPIGGKYYDWPVGYHVGLNLSDFWKLEPHKLGEKTFTHFPDGTAAKNRMQGNDFVQSLMYTRGVTCFSCHDPHGTENPALLRRPVNEVCMSCHGANTQNGPHASTIEAHTHHMAGSPGDQCVACHMPKIEPELAPAIPNLNVSSHTFHFVTPVETDILKIPNACNACHTDKDTKWAQAALKGWSDKSPWRMQ